MRSLATISLVLGLAAGTAGAEDEAARWRAYTDRFLRMEDTPAAHADLARWCEAEGLPDRARIHWEEALHRDAHHKEARAALGYVRHGAGWVAAGEAVAEGAGGTAPSVPAAADPTAARRRRELAHEIQTLVLEYLGTADPVTREAKRLRLLMVREPEAAEAVARHLGNADEECRLLMCEILGQIPGEEAGRLLAKTVLTDPSEAVARAGAAALRLRNADRGLRELVNALNGSAKATERAAYALGEIGEPATAPALIARLRKAENVVKVLEAPRTGSGGRSNLPGGYFFSGTVIPYIADAEPIVADRAVGWDLQIGYIPVGATIVAQNPRVTIYRTVIEFVPQPAVRDALRKMSGQDFEFNPQAWREWFEKARRDGRTTAEPSP